jgi:hypothetical protein
MGHALRKALGVVARQQGRGLAAVAELAAEAGAPVLGGSSLKAALDCDWDDPTARQHALVVVVDALDAVESFWLVSRWLPLEPGPGSRSACGGSAGLPAGRSPR